MRHGKVVLMIQVRDYIVCTFEDGELWGYNLDTGIWKQIHLPA